MKRIAYGNLIRLTATLAILSPFTGCIMFYSSPWYELEVVDADSQHPIPGAQVEVRHSGVAPIYLNVPGPRDGVTDEDGYLRMRVPEASGTARLWVVEAEGYETRDFGDTHPREVVRRRFELFRRQVSETAEPERDR